MAENAAPVSKARTRLRLIMIFVVLIMLILLALLAGMLWKSSLPAFTFLVGLLVGVVPGVLLGIYGTTLVLDDPEFLKQRS